jgi:hypothetical protein
LICVNVAASQAETAPSSLLQITRVVFIPGHTRRRVIVDVCSTINFVASIATLCLHTPLCYGKVVNSRAIFIAGRMSFILHISRILFGIWSAMTLRKHIFQLLRLAVSRNKRRYNDPVGGFDLDMAYICDRVIAMAVPSAINAPYRNDILEACRFFSEKHYGNFLIFNLCEEFEEAGNGNYAPSHFYGILPATFASLSLIPATALTPHLLPIPTRYFPAFIVP